MILRHYVTIQSRTAAKGSEGQKIFTFAYFKKLRCDVQPVTLAPSQVAAWGLTTTSSGARKMFYYLDQTIVENMRVLFEGKAYDIKGLNPWADHSEAFLVPVQGV